jgi:tetratricopeptide (TPR) repeat protein
LEGFVDEGFIEELKKASTAIGAKGDAQSAKDAVNKGVEYAEKRMHDQAIAEFTKAIELLPDHAIAYAHRGRSYHKKGNYDQAVADFTKAIQLNPNFADAYCARGDINFDFAFGLSFAEIVAGGADIKDVEKHINLAISDYTKAIQINPNYADAYNKRGVCFSWAGKKDYEQAISDYTKAIQIEPNNIEAYQLRADAYLAKKEYDKAWEDVHKVESLGGTLPPEVIKTLKEASGREK